MHSDLGAFLIGVGVLILYLVISAQTEMFTKLPWKNRSQKEKNNP